MKLLEGKTALITGASRGIGKAVALAFAKEGANIAFTDLRYDEIAQATEKEIAECGVKAKMYASNAADFAQTVATVDEIVKEFGRIDVLVNNAGITRDGLLMKMSEEDFDSVISTNLKGAFHTIRFASRQMIRQKSGRIINISSVVGVAGNAGQANYAAAKAGLIGLTKTTAKELASRGITVNAIAPGFISTDMTAGLSDKVKEAAAAQIPLGMFGRPEDVAAAAVFLASEDAGYITGQVLHVDGGMVM